MTADLEEKIARGMSREIWLAGGPELEPHHASVGAQAALSVIGGEFDLVEKKDHNASGGRASGDGALPIPPELPISAGWREILEAAAQRHFDLANVPKAPRWKNAAHGHKWDGINEAIHLLDLATNAAPLASEQAGQRGPLRESTPEELRAAFLAPSTIPITPKSAGPEWQPIDSATRDKTPVLLWFDHAPSDHIVIGRWSAKRDLWEFKNHASWGSSVRGAPTHWMPLPNPPAQTQTDGEKT